MAITASEFVEMLRLWEQCCSDTGDGWKAASEKLSQLEAKAGVVMDMKYNDFESFHISTLRALQEVA